MGWLRLSGTEIPANLKDVELAILLGTVTDMLQPVAMGKNVKWDLSGPTKIKVKTDATMLRSILQNLLSNALKFSPEHSIVRCHWDQVDGEVTIQISDQGSGLNEHLLEQINSGEWHDQSSQTGTKGETGKGFGLGIAQGFANRLGCRIEAENSPEEGSVFSIRLPVAN